MVFIKYIILFFIFMSVSYIGLALASRYKNRVRDLKNIRNILNIIETKIKYTYEPLPQIFLEISQEFTGGISELFKTSVEQMKSVSAGEAWKYALERSNTSLNSEDLEILKKLENLLGKTNAEGQLSEIKLMNNFIDIQIKKSEEEQNKNEKMYKNLGVIVGLAIVIILI